MMKFVNQTYVETLESINSMIENKRENDDGITWSNSLSEFLDEKKVDKRYLHKYKKILENDQKIQEIELEKIQVENESEFLSNISVKNIKKKKKTKKLFITNVNRSQLEQSILKSSNAQQYTVESLNQSMTLDYINQSLIFDKSQNLKEKEETIDLDFQKAIFGEYGDFTISKKVIMPRDPFLREQAEKKYMKK